MRPSGRILDLMTTQSITFTSKESWRASEIGGSGHLTRTETVYADGRVEAHVVGYSQDDGSINRRETRHYGPLDLEAVRVARLRAGWVVRP